MRNKLLQLNSLANDKILNWSKLKTFTEDNMNEPQMIICVFDREENIVGKGENAGYQHFLFFPQCSQAPSFSGSSEVGIVW